MNQVRVWLHPVLRKYARKNHLIPSSGEALVAVEEGASVKDLLRFLGLPPGSTEVILVNGDLAAEDSSLPMGCFVEVYPIFGGG